jgi:hypothetical protein
VRPESDRRYIPASDAAQLSHGQQVPSILS